MVWFNDEQSEIVMFNSTASVLQTLSGNKLHVLIALFSMAVLPVGEQEVAAVCGMNRKTARSHLRQLAALGLVARGGYREKESWTLTSAAHQLPLPLRSLAAGDVEASSQSPLEASSQSLLPQPSSQSAAETPAAHNAGDVGNFYPHGSDVGKSYPHRFAHDDAVVVINSQQVDLKQQQQHVGAGDVGKSYPLGPSAALLRRLGMDEPVPQLYGHMAAAVVLGHWWYAATWASSPQGYLRRRLEQGHDPPAGFLSLAAAWLGMDDELQRCLHLAATGSDEGRLLHPPAKNPAEVRFHWDGDEDLPLDDAAIDAYLLLLEKAPEALERYGGFSCG